METTRRSLLAAGIAAGALPLLPRAAGAAGIATGEPVPFSLDILKDMAAALAGEPYAPAPVEDAELLDSIDYDLHNQITYRKDAMLWGDVPGAAKVRFFHPGRYFKEPVAISVLEGGEARELVFSTDLFDMPEGHPARQLKHAGFAGFAVMDPEGKNDWMAVLGASYFRTSGYSGQFGMSARGLAIDSGGPGPEEFPRFTRFWLEQAPEGGIVIYALLESPRATGAYRMATAHRPGEGVFQEIEATLFLRGDIDRLGIAPLTSMFWYGKNNHFIGPDWRPEIHDSDGLEMALASGERIWRPLNNPPRVMVNSFRADGLKGFGLAQRERSFEEYQDDGVFYEKRATCWITPEGDWGAGSVMLVELSTNDEIHDNIVAFWNPAEPAAAGVRHDLRYRLDWVEAAPPQSVASFIATRIGAGGVPGQPRPANQVKFVLDLDGKGLEGLDRSSRVEAVVEASRGTVSLIYAYPIATTDRWRVTFDLDVGPAEAPDDPIDLRLYLRHDDQAMSETWIYQVFPSQMHELLSEHA
jgi:glucans biosynthesis protein